MMMQMKVVRYSNLLGKNTFRMAANHPIFHSNHPRPEYIYGDHNFTCIGFFIPFFYFSLCSGIWCLLSFFMFEA